MQNYWYNKSQPHLISVATLPCELDNGHVLQSAKSYWQLQLNQTGLAVCVQVFDWSTTVRKVAVIAENAMSKSKKQCLEWPPPALTHPERQRRHCCTEAAMTAWSSLAHSVLMRCLSSSKSVTDTLWSTGFKFGEFGGHGTGRMTSGVSLLAKRHFQWRHTYVIIT